MERAFKWLMLALVAAEVILVRFGLIDLRTAVGVVVGLELLLYLVVGRQIFVAVRRYRRERSTGLDVWAAAEQGLAVLLPPRLARLAVMEPRLWFCLGQWLFRRHRLKDGEFTYHKRSIVWALVLLVVFTTPVELLLFELLLPWAWVRWALLILGVYMLFWVFGFYASLVVLPHRLEASRLMLHHGILASADIPYADVEAFSLGRQKAPKVGDGLQVVAEEKTAYLAIGGRTDATLYLRRPLTLQGALGPTAPVTTVHLALDQPAQFVRDLALRLEAEAEI